MLAEAINGTVGVAVGTFVGVLVGLGIRARKGQRSGLVRDSVLMTAVLAAMVGWTVAALLSLTLG